MDNRIFQQSIVNERVIQFVGESSQLRKLSVILHIYVVKANIDSIINLRYLCDSLLDSRAGNWTNYLTSAHPYNPTAEETTYGIFGTIFSK